MESMNLLITDRTPESAERINSLLRNSGIKIHVIHAEKAIEVKRALDQVAPLLILHVNPDPQSASLEEIGALATDYSVPLALYSDFENVSELLDLLKTTTCQVIYSENESQLTDLIRRLASSYEATRNQTNQRAQMEELEHRYDLLLTSQRDAMAYIHEGLHVYANRAYLEALHVHDLDEIAGISLLEMMQHYYSTSGRNIT